MYFFIGDTPRSNQELQPLSTFMNNMRLQSKLKTPSSSPLASSVHGTQFKVPVKGITIRISGECSWFMCLLGKFCQLCDENERLLRKSKESIRSLKLQLARLEEKYSLLRKSSSSTFNTYLLNESKVDEDSRYPVQVRHHIIISWYQTSITSIGNMDIILTTLSYSL